MDIATEVTDELAFELSRKKRVITSSLTAYQNTKERNNNSMTELLMQP
jgi:hypothetical protein